jgi:pyruvate-ferredoxin/flavodoxin oxidoreductase
MGELADALSARGVTNLWGDVPRVVEMQSEGGAAGALHGALQGGALATTFTASQGLLLMLPDMYKIAGELTPAVIHVAARAIATHALSIFGDHSDVMAARSTGWSILHSTSVQEAQDLAVVAHAATLASRVPIVHVIDGFRTSHELNRIELVDDAVLSAMVDADLVAAHRGRSLHPARPVVRGTAQNPDAFFQAREASNPFHDAAGATVEEHLDRFAALTGRRYGVVEYHGDPDAERVLVLSGSGVWAARSAVDHLVKAGERVGVVNLRLFRPVPTEALLAALPPTVRAVAVLDRCKEPGASGEPLLLDVTAALAGAAMDGRGPQAGLPRVVGGRYGLASKEFTPAMAAATLDELAAPRPRPRFTVGITDDVGGLSLPVEADRFPAPPEETRAVLIGLGSDGTVGAAKNACHAVSEVSGRHAQGYFVYDSKKSGAVTVSHLRFADHHIEAPWLVRDADYVGVHQFSLLDRLDVLATARPGATVLLNSPHGAGATWEHLPAEVQRRVLDDGLRLHVVDAGRLSREVGLGGIVSTVMLACFVELAGLLPPDRAADALKAALGDMYGSLGEAVLAPNFAAVDAAPAHIERVDTAGRTVTAAPRPDPVPVAAPAPVRRVTAELLAGRGDLLPVSAFSAEGPEDAAVPPDGSFPVGTTRWEKRGIAVEVPAWDPDLCIDCGRCAAVCPHAAVRTKAYDPGLLADAPASFGSKPAKDAHLAGLGYTVQVFPDDCTGCGLCVQVCPARDRSAPRHKALDMTDRVDVADAQRAAVDFFLALPQEAPSGSDPTTTRGAQLRTPLFEFSGACAGCGETPYLKLLTQLFGDHVAVANATGCSSIYGGNLPTTPWGADASGRGPAWSNSLFEDNAEFGLGIRLALDHRRDAAVRLVGSLAGAIGADLARELVEAATGRDAQADDAGRAAQRARVAELRARLDELAPDVAPHDVQSLATLADDLVRTDVWIVGGDGWAYDIGFGGLDHVLASGADVNVLVLDTEGYSNTGGQASKSTFRSAVAKFASGGKEVRKKDLGMLAAGYGDVYVAQVAMGANDLQTVRAFHEAAAHPGPSLILAYSHCIAHGIDMSRGAEHQKLAVKSGYWPLWRYDPAHAHRGDHPLRLDSRAPSVPFAHFARSQTRFSLLERANPSEADRLFALAQHDIDERWHFYEQLGQLERWADDEVEVQLVTRAGHAAGDGSDSGPDDGGAPAADGEEPA